MADPLETAELLAFTKVVDAGSVSRAAIELGVPRATLGRRLALLEERVGVRLLRITTRSLVLTDAGSTFYPHARMVLDAAARAEESLRAPGGGSVRGDLRVSVPAMVPPSFNAMVCEFLRSYPDVRLHLHLTNRVVDLRREGYDLALRASQDLEPGVVARTLMRDSLVAVASPQYLSSHGIPRTKRDLVRHRCLIDFSGDMPQHHWPVMRSGHVHVDGVLLANSRLVLRDAVLGGLGIAVLPMLEVRSLLARGDLVHVLPGVIGGELHVVVAFPERELVPPQVRAFADAMTKWAVAEIKELEEAARVGVPPKRGRTASPSTRSR